LRPIGDNLLYDLLFDVGGRLLRIQVKCAWFDEPSDNYVVDNRRTRTNRHIRIRADYQQTDFALVYLADRNVFYVFPIPVFVNYGSEIHMVEREKRQCKPRSAEYRQDWHQLV
jgi:hypothetical protein